DQGSFMTALACERSTGGRSDLNREALGAISVLSLFLSLLLSDAITTLPPVPPIRGSDTWLGSAARKPALVRANGQTAPSAKSAIPAAPAARRCRNECRRRS